MEASDAFLVAFKIVRFLLKPLHLASRTNHVRAISRNIAQHMAHGNGPGRKMELTLFKLLPGKVIDAPFFVNLKMKFSP